MLKLYAHFWSNQMWPAQHSVQARYTSDQMATKKTKDLEFEMPQTEKQRKSGTIAQKKDTNN